MMIVIFLVEIAVYRLDLVASIFVKYRLLYTNIFLFAYFLSYFFNKFIKVNLQLFCGVKTLHFGLLWVMFLPN